MLVTDQGKLIRTPVSGIRIAGRSTQGVIVLNTAEDERVVSVERLSEERRRIDRCHSGACIGIRLHRFPLKRERRDYAGADRTRIAYQRPPAAVSIAAISE